MLRVPQQKKWTIHRAVLQLRRLPYMKRLLAREAWIEYGVERRLRHRRKETVWQISK